jgi:hypothetical protein
MLYRVVYFHTVCNKIAHESSLVSIRHKPQLIYIYGRNRRCSIQEEEDSRYTILYDVDLVTYIGIHKRTPATKYLNKVTHDTYLNMEIPCCLDYIYVLPYL